MHSLAFLGTLLASLALTIGCGGHAAGGGNADAAVDGPAPVCVAGTTVCGNGNGGTVVNTSYTCNGTTIGTGSACAFGCDDTNGQCSDFFPANQAATHLASSPAADTFTCIGAQVATLPDIIAGAGDTIAINTSAPTITKNTVTIAGVLWGTAYTPTSGTTTVIVAHVKSLQISGGATVTITGASALVLLVDTNVTISGASVIDLAAHLKVNQRNSGPGGGVTITSGEGGAFTVVDESGGGGGGGYAVAGGAGGDGNGGTTPVVGGATFGGTFVLAAGGYGGGIGFDNVGKGGGGMQVSACGDVSIGAGVIVNASGGGGKAGSSNATPTGGYGGGAGGTIILEGATTSSLDGALVANGGGGGQGGINPVGVTATLDGSDWNPATAYNAPAPNGWRRRWRGSLGWRRRRGHDCTCECDQCAREQCGRRWRRIVWRDLHRELAGRDQGECDRELTVTVLRAHVHDDQRDGSTELPVCRAPVI